MIEETRPPLIDSMNASTQQWPGSMFEYECPCPRCDCRRSVSEEDGYPCQACVAGCHRPKTKEGR